MSSVKECIDILNKARLEMVGPGDNLTDTHSATVTGEHSKYLKDNNIRVVLPDGPCFMIFGNIDAEHTITFSEGRFLLPTSVLEFRKKICDLGEGGSVWTE